MTSHSIPAVEKHNIYVQYKCPNITSKHNCLSGKLALICKSSGLESQDMMQNQPQHYHEQDNTSNYNNQPQHYHEQDKSSNYNNQPQHYHEQDKTSNVDTVGSVPEVVFHVIVISTSGLVTCGSITCDNYVTSSRDNSIDKGTLKNIEMSLCGILMIHNDRWGYLVNTRGSRGTRGRLVCTSFVCLSTILFLYFVTTTVSGTTSKHNCLWENIYGTTSTSKHNCLWESSHLHHKSSGLENEKTVLCYFQVKDIKNGTCCT